MSLCGTYDLSPSLIIDRRPSPQSAAAAQALSTIIPTAAPFLFFLSFFFLKNSLLFSPYPKLGRNQNQTSEIENQNAALPPPIQLATLVAIMKSISVECARIGRWVGTCTGGGGGGGAAISHLTERENEEAKQNEKRKE